MATVTKQGRGYKITVSFGFDGAGRRRREHMTWVPDPKMTARQIEKELNRQVVLFEEQVKSGSNAVDGSIRFSAWAEKFMEEYAKSSLKPHTVAHYKQQLVRINQAIGHIKLKELKPGHISKFYANLQEAGIRGKERAVATIDVAAWCAAHQLSLHKLGELAGVSPSVRQKLTRGEPILKEKALLIAQAMNADISEVFRIEKDLTPLKPISVTAYHRTLSAILSRAVREGYLSTNPAARASLPRNEMPEQAYLDEADARKLLELLQLEPIEWRTVIAFDLLSGLRRAEILGLRWRDIDLDNQLIYVRQTWNYTPQRGCYVDTPKSRSGARPLKVSRTAILLLLEYKRWQDHRRELVGDAWADVDGRVFTRDDGRPFFPDSLTQWFGKFIKRSGLPRVHVHSLRHTYASLQIAEGTPLIVVSRNLGHAKASTTSNIYAHVIASAEAKAAEVMDRFADVLDREKTVSGTNVALKEKAANSA